MRLVHANQSGSSGNRTSRTAPQQSDTFGRSKSISFGSERSAVHLFKMTSGKKNSGAVCPSEPIPLPICHKANIAFLSTWTDFPSRFVAVFACGNQGFKGSVMQSFLLPLSFLKTPVYGKAIKSFCFSF